jgi:dTDP-4-amino-4,6-dideoxygalactose transaminase
LDLRRQSAEIDAELEDAFRRVLRSGHYILGPEVDALEKECAQYIGVKHAIGVSSGSDALLVALMALGIGPGDEVICPTYTFFATAGAIWRLGAKPVFCDINPTCYNCDASSIKRCLTPQTKAVIPVHLFGQCADMDPIVELAREKGLHVIEDAAQAIGAEYRGKRAGTMGSLACFSFFPSKNLGALGDAGLLTTSDDALAEKARILRSHGGKPKYYHHVVGGNFRIDALQAALIRVKLRHLDEATKRRQANASLYTELFQLSELAAPNTCESPCSQSCPRSSPADPTKVLLPVTCQSRHIYNQYVIRVAGEGRRDRLQAFLKDKKIGTEIYYPVPMHLQSCFASLSYKSGSFPVAEAAARETLALPIFPELTGDEIRYVVDRILEFFRS